jgi:hypothetical protein
MVRTGAYLCSLRLDVPDSKMQTRIHLLAESLVLFESVLNSRWFLRTSIILFLTKFKEFSIKLSQVRYNLILVFLLPKFLFISSVSPRKLLPRVYRGRGWKQGVQVHSLAIHAGQSRTIKRVPPVITPPLPIVVVANLLATTASQSSLTYLTFGSSSLLSRKQFFKTHSRRAVSFDKQSTSVIRVLSLNRSNDSCTSVHHHYLGNGYCECIFLTRRQSSNLKDESRRGENILLACLTLFLRCRI